MSQTVEAVATTAVGAWSHTADVVVVGYGIAGTCAALAARRAGADVLVIERGGGGASAISCGIFYLGGGTPVQTACGYHDPADNMYRYLEATIQPHSSATLRAFCDGSVVMSKGSLTPRQQFWAEHLQRCAERSQSLAAYAAEHGLKVGHHARRPSSSRRDDFWFLPIRTHPFRTSPLDEHHGFQCTRGEVRCAPLRQRTKPFTFPIRRADDFMHDYLPSALARICMRISGTAPSALSVAVRYAS